jgi:hypothetical protein
MADVFISYSKQDKALAEQLAGLLQEIGFTVWWDADLVPAEEFRDSIRRQIEAARAVIVIWSANSAKSAFVIDEADAAREAGKLISALAEGFSAARVPLGFRNAHMTPLADGGALIKALAARGLTPGKPISAFLLALFHDRMASVRRRRTWLLPAALSLVIAGLVAWIALNQVLGRSAVPAPVERFYASYSYNVLYGHGGVPERFELALDTQGSKPFYRHGLQVYVLTPDLQAVKTEEFMTPVYHNAPFGPPITIDARSQAALAAQGYVATCIHVSATANGPISKIGMVRKADRLRMHRAYENSPEYVNSIDFGPAEVSVITALSKMHGCDYRL